MLRTYGSSPSPTTSCSTLSSIYPRPITLSASPVFAASFCECLPFSSATLDDLRLRPEDHLAFRGVRLHPAAQPRRIAVFVPAAAVIVKPVLVLAVGALPREVGSPRMLDPPPIGVSLVLRLRPGAAAV